MPQLPSNLRDRVMLGLLSLGALFLLIPGIWGIWNSDILGPGDIVPYAAQNPLSLAGLALLGLFTILALYPVVAPVWKLLFAPRAIPARDQAVISRRCQEVDHLLTEATPSSLKNAVVTIDSLLDHALKVLGYRGSLAEKLKAAGKRFRAIDQIWQAHRFRNRLVHEVNTTVSIQEARSVVQTIKSALLDLGALEGQI